MRRLSPLPCVVLCLSALASDTQVVTGELTLGRDDVRGTVHECGTRRAFEVGVMASNQYFSYSSRYDQLSDGGKFAVLAEISASVAPANSSSRKLVLNSPRILTMTRGDCRSPGAQPNPGPEPRDLEFAIVSGLESLQRVRSESNLYPWDRARPDEVIVSTSCGFARVVYNRVSTPGFARLQDDRNPEPWTALVRLGEYCKLAGFVLDGLNLVAYRKWEGENYMIASAEVRVGEDERLYVDDPLFIEEVGLESLSVQTAERTNRRIYVNTIPMRPGK